MFVSDARFARETAVRGGGEPGLWRAELSAEWCAPSLPQGGLAAGVAARAMAAELGSSEQRLRSLTTVFAAPVEPGPVEVAVTVLRRGRSMTQLLAAVRNAGEASGHTSIAVFGALRRGFASTDIQPPTVAAPD